MRALQQFQYLSVSSVCMECISVIRRRENKKTQLLPIQHADSVGERV